jgi:hypothetical protein
LSTSCGGSERAISAGRVVPVGYVDSFVVGDAFVQAVPPVGEPAERGVSASRAEILAS